MAIKAIQTAGRGEEISHHADGLALCLLVNRRQKTVRVIDFRSGPHPAKRRVVMNLARREGAERVFTLVERDEVGTWNKLGFHREGSIPGFYKRSDAWILGARVELESDVEESGVRLVVTPPEVTEATAESAYQAARKLMKERDGMPRPTVKLQAAKPDECAKAVDAAFAAGRGLTRFEHFGRDVERSAWVATGRGGYSLHLSVESQVCFDNAFIEVLTSPRTDKEAAFVTAAVEQLCAQLASRQIVGSFALSPVGDAGLAAAFLAAGFRKTGVLAQHLVVRRERVDALLWSRKLAQPEA
jgi:hypothetical protein